ncbi:MAG: hypothetical protein RLN86_14350 [Cyclobacteriaceae bacterium]
MLLRFFRINDPYRLLGVLLIIILISLPFLMGAHQITLNELKGLVLGETMRSDLLMYVHLFDDTPPFATFLYWLMDSLFGRSILARQIIVVMLIFFQASYFGVKLIYHKAYNENTYLPSLIFGVLCFFSLDVVSFSAEIVASLLLLLSLNKIYNLLEFKVQRDEIVLKLGVYMGLSTLLIFSYWIFLIGTLGLLIIFARLQFRRGVLLFFGFFLPHLLLLTYYYYNDGLALLWINFYKSNLTFSGEMLMSAKALLILSGLPLLYFVFSIFMMNRQARLTKYQSQITQMMFLWTIIASVQILISRQISPASFVTFIPSLAYFISYYFLLIRRKWIAELMLWVLVIGVVSVGLLAKHRVFSSVDYAQLNPEETRYDNLFHGKSVMVLGNAMSVYKSSNLGGGFLNWELSKPVLSDMTNYWNVEVVASVFEANPPDVIIDESNMVEQVFDRIPALKSKYRKDGIYYTMINN